jgi:two-component system, chemotaxis family, response regulator Rcp1
MILEILLVEDNEAQAYLVRKALESWKTPYNLHVVSSAEEAIELFSDGTDSVKRPLPHLALVDLNLKNKPGFAVVETIKQRPDLRNVAVMVLSSSTSQADVQKAVNLHANAYFVKPMSFDGIVSLFETIEAFWRNDYRFMHEQHSQASGM